MVQNKNKIVNALAIAESIFTILAAFSGEPANRVNIRPNIIKNGAPGGCPTSKRYAEAINSPQSQKLVVGSIVKRYTIAAIRKAIQPNKLL